MSVRIMTAVWDMSFSPVEKLVLLALADWANDDGVAWPSIAQLARKTGCGERTVQRTLRAAETSGLLRRHENKGRGCSYTLDPRHAGTPATVSPVPETTETPATLAPNTPVTTKPKKASPSKAKRANKFTLPFDIPADEWADFEEMRKVARKPMTDSIRLKCVKRLRKLAEDGYPPGDVLSYSTLNNYQGLFPPKDDHNGRSTPRNRMAGHRQPGAESSRSKDGFLNAIRDASDPWRTSVAG